ncbi:hypothetical protein [Coxiella burnetii]|nr:hypothetical protein [Coxiella burnetii]UYK69258.1 hypothetical protein OHM78_07805 [Coxiella burnetii]
MRKKPNVEENPNQKSQKKKQENETRNHILKPEKKAHNPRQRRRQH